MRRPRTKVDSQVPPGYHSSMSGENDRELLNFIATTVETMRDQMATKDDIVRLESRMDVMREQMATKEDLAQVEATLRQDMVTKADLARVEASLREDMATKNDVSRLEKTMRGEFEQVHIRLDSIDRRVDTRVGQIETDVSRLRSVVYLLVKDKPDMLRLLGQTTLRENPPQG
jgi:hypothetical protein